MLFNDTLDNFKRIPSKALHFVGQQKTRVNCYFHRAKVIILISRNKVIWIIQKTLLILSINLNFMFMKKILFGIFILFFYQAQLQAQTVFSCDSKYDADVKVYVASSKYDADLVVYKCSSKYDATDNKGLWFFVTSKYDAKKKIFFVDSKYDADIIIYFTDSKYDAGWRNNSKKDKMF